jgi:hypothetical protein
MGNTLFQSLQLSRRRPAPQRSLPRGYGLLIGASISIGLWGLIIWGLIKAFQ